jgi:hypothetical protein
MEMIFTIIFFIIGNIIGCGIYLVAWKVFSSKDTMIPNKNPDECVIFCSCVGNCEHFTIRKASDNEYWVEFTTTPKNLWQIIEWWWKQRKLYRGDFYLTKEDMQFLRDKLNAL